MLELFRLIGTIAVDNNGANAGIDDTTGKAEKSESRITSAFKKIGAAVVTYFAVDKIIEFGKKCITAASDVEEMQNKFDVVFDGMTDTVDEWATNYAASIGRNKNVIKEYLADNQNMFVGMGMTREAGASLSEKMVQLGLDLASFNNLSEDDAVNALSKAIMGESESAKTLGAVLNDNTRAQAMLQLGYEGTYDKLDETQKMEVNYQAILNQSADAVGDCERSMGSYKSTTIEMQSAVEGLQEKIGGYLLPAATAIMAKFVDLANIVTDNVDPAFDALQTAAGEVKNAYETYLQPALSNLGDAFTKVKDAVQPVIDKITSFISNTTSSIYPVDLLNTAASTLGDGINSLADFISTAVDNIKEFHQWCKDNKTALELVGIAVGTVTAAVVAYNAAQAIKNAGGIIELAQLAATAIGVGALTVAETAHTVATTIATAATTAFGTALAFVTSPVTLVIVAIGALIAIGVLLYKNWDVIKEKCTEIFGSIHDWINEKIEAIKGFFSGLMEHVSSVWDGIKNVIDIGVQLIASILTAAFDLITLPFQFIWQNCGDTITAAWEKISSIVQTGVDFVKNVIIFVFEAIKTYFTTVFNIYMTIFTTVFDAIKTIVSNVVNGIKSVITFVFEAIKTYFTTVVNIYKTIFETVFNAIKTVITNIINGIKTTVETVFNAVKSAIETPLNTAKTTVLGIFDGIKNGISEKLNAAKNAVSGIIDKIKGFFNFTFEIPGIKLPHFKVNPDGWKIGDLLKGEIPSLGIDWYAKAMDSPMIMNEPTAFGINANGQIRAGGEAGSEVVSGTGTLMNMISAAVASQNGDILNALYMILDAVVRLDDNMGGNLREALEGLGIRWNKRELGRLVREVQ